MADKVSRYSGQINTTPYAKDALVKSLVAQTGLTESAVRELLDNGWTFTQNGNKTSWVKS